jgi:hypothetical protein
LRPRLCTTAGSGVFAGTGSRAPKARRTRRRCCHGQAPAATAGGVRSRFAAEGAVRRSPRGLPVSSSDGAPGRSHAARDRHRDCVVGRPVVEDEHLEVPIVHGPRGLQAPADHLRLVGSGDQIVTPGQAVGRGLGRRGPVEAAIQQPARRPDRRRASCKDRTADRAWSPSAARTTLRTIAVTGGVRRRFGARIGFATRGPART